MSDPLVLIAVGAALGLVLGMLGGGGGISAVPALVALGEPVLVASTMSLVIVGTGAAAALVRTTGRAGSTGTSGSPSVRWARSERCSAPALRRRQAPLRS
ncbi:MAG TPA: hypothetical protein VIJ96_17230 [Acidothermaceae bacterium]